MISHLISEVTFGFRDKNTILIERKAYNATIAGGFFDDIILFVIGAWRQCVSVVFPRV